MGTAVPSGIHFPALNSCDPYISLSKHRPSSGGRDNKWSSSIKPSDEYLIFKRSFMSRWLDPTGHLWGLQNNLVTIGSNGERLAKFPRRANESDPWHGYPVSALDQNRRYQHCPPPALISEWIDRQIVSESQGARIRRGKV